MRLLLANEKEISEIKRTTEAKRTAPSAHGSNWI
jgi:hypothetical protein